MRLFMAARIGSGDGTRRDPFRPNVDLAAAGGEWGAYELADGQFLCVAPNAQAPIRGVIDLGDNTGDRLSGVNLGRVADATGSATADLSNLTVGESLLLTDGKIAPNSDGRVKITLAGVDLYDAPAIQGGATDTFTYSDGNLATVSSAVWAGVSSDATVVSNALSWTGSALRISRYATAFAGDHYSQVDYSVSNGEVSSVLRCSAAAVSCFYGYINNSGNAELIRFTAGADVALASNSGLATSGTLKGTSVGSVQTFYRNGVSILSATDSTWNANDYVGVGGFGVAGCTADNWEGGTGTGTAVTFVADARWDYRSPILRM